MGLDQYLYSCDSTEEMTHQEAYNRYPDEYCEVSEESKDNLVKVLNNRKQIAYWRKHANLQGYIEDYAEMDINCKYIRLTEDIIRDIKEMSVNKNMANAVGFCWGETEDCDYEQTVEAMDKALEEINKGKKIYYYGWY